jgi:hypothetical protein
VSVVLVAVSLSTPSAVPLGTLNISSHTGVVTIGLTQIAWTPTAPTAPNAITTNGTNVTYNGGNVLSAGMNVSLADVYLSYTLPNFISFPAHPSLALHLSQVGPGMTQANCRAAKKIGDSCALAVGSPFILTMTPTGTALSFSTSGEATDATGTPSVWRGVFTSQITVLPGVASDEVVQPADIQAYFWANPAATITSSYSAQINVFFVP